MPSRPDLRPGLRVGGARSVLGACAGLLALLLVAEATLSESDSTHVVSALTGIVLILVSLAAGRRLRLAERALYRAAQSYIDLAGASLITIDTDYRVSMANPRACEVFGRAEHELRGQPFQNLIASGPDRERSARRFAAIMGGDLAAATGRVRRTIIRPDTSTREVEWQLVASRDERGAINGLLVSGEDITDAIHREAELARDLQDVQRLRELTQIIATTADARPALLSCAVGLLDADTVSLALRNPDPGEGWTITHSSEPPRIGQVIPEGGNDPRSCLRIKIALSGDPRAALLIVEGAQATNSGPRFDQLVEFLAGEAILALQAIDSRSELQRAALTDPLTGIANRRAFDVELADHVQAAASMETELSLILLDLDGFKALNDREGHEAGDDLLRSCASAWSTVVRAGDMVARLGGDEFAVILPSCSPDTAAHIRRRLELSTPLPVGVSSGIATWSGQSPQQLLAQADGTMYLMKAEQRVGRIVDPDRLGAVDANRGRLAAQEACLDAVAQQLRGTLGVPGVFVTLVDDEHVSSMGAAGADDQPRRSTLENSYCQHVVAASAPVIISDAAADPLVNGSSGPGNGLAAYAGVPLAGDDGQILGAVCAIDSQPREWSATDLDQLHDAAREIRALLVGAAPEIDVRRGRGASPVVS